MPVRVDCAFPCDALLPSPFPADKFYLISMNTKFRREKLE